VTATEAFGEEFFGQRPKNSSQKGKGWRA